MRKLLFFLIFLFLNLSVVAQTKRVMIETEVIKLVKQVCAKDSPEHPSDHFKWLESASFNDEKEEWHVLIMLGTEEVVFNDVGYSATINADGMVNCFFWP